MLNVNNYIHFDCNVCGCRRLTNKLHGKGGLAAIGDYIARRLDLAISRSIYHDRL